MPLAVSLELCIMHEKFGVELKELLKRAHSTLKHQYIKIP